MEESIKILEADPKFKVLVEKHGKPTLKPSKNYFQALVRSIIYQQLSGNAASTIYNRFTDLFSDKKFPTPQQVTEMPQTSLRAVGLSSQKVSYLKDLAEKFTNGTVKQKALSKMSNEELVAHLTKVKGIGIWTVHMFLIFTLCRPDVLPTGDLGIKKGFQSVYQLSDLPDPEEMESLAKPWRNHASVASWYLWKAADQIKADK